MSLKTYAGKRDFNVTSEPAAESGRGHERPIFVIQEHHASRLHWDFRLEADEVLKSWAVTKEPVPDTSIRRLAVEVEDHPLAYADFSGDIPEGEYGAGHVEIWDHGTYRNLMAGKEKPMTLAESIEAGHVEVELHGKKLRGGFALIRMKGNDGRNWLLVKMKDDEARHDSKAQEAAKKEKPEHAKPTGRRRTQRQERPAPPEEIECSSTGKMMFPETGITKGDVLAYYGRIADRLIPHLRDRPMTLERLPDGLASAKSPHFWQKDTPDYYPDWIPRAALETEDGRTVEYLLVNDRQTLLYLVNQGTITFHPWLSRIGSLDRPDYVLFDLDPGESSFADAIAVAREIRSVLANEGIDAYAKSSGKTGLHVLAPWHGDGAYDEARTWAMEIAECVTDSLPDAATTERRKSARRGRLYLDVMQNARGHHVVPPYVLRAVPGATISTPLRWEEVTDDLAPDRFDIGSIFRRISHQKDDPIAPLLAAFRNK